MANAKIAHTSKICPNCGGKVQVATNKFCRRSCYDAFMLGSRNPNFEPIFKRIWHRIDRRGPDECWPWTGATDKDGYGKIRNQINGERRYFRPHRVVYAIVYGPPKESDVIMHTCDNPACCNYHHLRAGTHADNIADRDAKGRARHPRGEDNGLSVLSADDVREIRRRYKPYEVSQQSLANEYGVGQTQIGRIIRRTRWRHLK